MRPESGTATLGVFRPKRTKSWGRDGASVDATCLGLTAPGVFLATALQFPALLLEAKDEAAAASPPPPGFPILV